MSSWNGSRVVVSRFIRNYFTSDLFPDFHNKHASEKIRVLMGAGLDNHNTVRIHHVSSWNGSRVVSRLNTSPTGASFRSNGYHGESAWPDEAELGLLRAHWIIGPPFVDRKCLATLPPTLSNAAGVWWVADLVDSRGRQPCCLQYHVSHNASNAFSKCFLLDCPGLGLS